MRVKKIYIVFVFLFMLFLAFFNFVYKKSCKINKEDFPVYYNSKKVKFFCLKEKRIKGVKYIIKSQILPMKILNYYDFLLLRKGYTRHFRKNKIKWNTIYKDNGKEKITIKQIIITWANKKKNDIKLLSCKLYLLKHPKNKKDKIYEEVIFQGFPLYEYTKEIKMSDKYFKTTKIHNKINKATEKQLKNKKCENNHFIKHNISGRYFKIRRIPYNKEVEKSRSKFDLVCNKENICFNLSKNILINNKSVKKVSITKDLKGLYIIVFYHNIVNFSENIKKIFHKSIFALTFKNRIILELYPLCIDNEKIVFEINITDKKMEKIKKYLIGK